jgi:ribosome-binding protein aMBF1 (putative translation factor)
MGRPSFKIDRKRLRELREDKGLTQADLASEICKRLVTGH